MPELATCVRHGIDRCFAEVEMLDLKSSHACPGITHLRERVCAANDRRNALLRLVQAFPKRLEQI